MTYAGFNGRNSVLEFMDYHEGVNFCVPIIETPGSILNLNCVITNIRSSILHIERNTEIEGLNVDVEAYVPYYGKSYVDEKKKILSKKNVFISKKEIELGEFLDTIIFPDINFLSLYSSLLMKEIGEDSRNIH